MKFVSENVIEEVVAQDTSDAAAHLLLLEQEQPIWLAYLVHEQFDLLTEAERDYFLNLAWILYQSVDRVRPIEYTIEEDEIGEAEEANWTLLAQSNKQSFRTLLDPFFEQTDQEDLLAFVEDALTAEEENDFLTDAGKELMFVGLKTTIDVLTQ